ncbi:hypothetical protein QL285_072873 [Trifolium repens]|jgi:hypothetical protein|nr:hypothetical protein QL285_072873 [Trifolium repens]
MDATMDIRKHIAARNRLIRRRILFHKRRLQNKHHKSPNCYSDSKPLMIAPKFKQVYTIPVSTTLRNSIVNKIINTEHFCGTSQNSATGVPTNSSPGMSTPINNTPHSTSFIPTNNVSKHSSTMSTPINNSSNNTPQSARFIRKTIPLTSDDTQCTPRTNMTSFVTNKSTPQNQFPINPTSLHTITDCSQRRHPPVFKTTLPSKTPLADITSFVLNHNTSCFRSSPAKTQPNPTHIQHNNSNHHNHAHHVQVNLADKFEAVTTIPNLQRQPEVTNKKVASDNNPGPKRTFQSANIDGNCELDSTDSSHSSGHDSFEGESDEYSSDEDSSPTVGHINSSSMQGYTLS